MPTRPALSDVPGFHQLFFSDMIGGNLHAAKYCTLWSKMLAADAFSAVKEVHNDKEFILDDKNA